MPGTDDQNLWALAHRRHQVPVGTTQAATARSHHLGPLIEGSQAAQKHNAVAGSCAQVSCDRETGRTAAALDEEMVGLPLHGSAHALERAERHASRSAGGALHSQLGYETKREVHL